MGTVCRFTQLHGNTYKLEIVGESNDKRDEKVGERLNEVNVEPFLRESALLKALHQYQPNFFELKATHECIGVRQIECFANYVNAGNARMDAGHAGNACVDADTQRQESLRRLRDLVDARERAMADSVAQMRKHLIRLQIQSVTGDQKAKNQKKEGEEKEDGTDATRRQMLADARRVLSSVDDVSDFPSHLLDLLEPVGQSATTAALSGNVTFLSQLRLIAGDRLKAWQVREREKIETTYQAQIQLPNRQSHPSKQIFINDENEMVKLCKFAQVIEAPKFLDECLRYVKENFPKASTELLAPSHGKVPIISHTSKPSLSPSQARSSQISQHNIATAAHSVDSVPSITPPNLTQSVPILIEGQTPKQPAPTQRSPIPQPSPSPTSPLQSSKTQPVQSLSQPISSLPAPNHISSPPRFVPQLPHPTPTNQQIPTPQPTPQLTHLSANQSLSLPPSQPSQLSQPSQQSQPSQSLQPSHHAPLNLPRTTISSHTATPQILPSQQVPVSLTPEPVSRTSTSPTPPISRDNQKQIPTPFLSGHPSKSESGSQMQLQQRLQELRNIMYQRSSSPTTLPSPDTAHAQPSSTNYTRPHSSLDAFFASQSVLTGKSSEEKPHVTSLPSSLDGKYKDSFYSNEKTTHESEINTRTTPISNSSSDSTDSFTTDLNYNATSSSFPSSTSHNQTKPTIPSSTIRSDPSSSNSMLRTLLQDYKAKNQPKINGISSLNTSHAPQLPPFNGIQRPESPPYIQNRIQNLLHDHLQSQAQYQSAPPTSSSGGPSNASQFVLGLLKDHSTKRQEDNPFNKELAEDKLHREQILARIREETKKTFELNSKYREMINNAKNDIVGATNEPNTINGGDEIIDDLERERRSLQRQQEEHQNAIRKAWGTNTEEVASDSSDEEEEGHAGETRHVRFGDSSIEEYSSSGEEVEENASSKVSTNSTTNEARVKEGLMLARMRALEKKQKLEEDKSKHIRSEKVKRLVESVRETAKEEYRRTKEKKGEVPPVQEEHPTAEELALLAKQEEEMRVRAIERVKESKAKVNMLNQRDEEERKKKEQEKWNKRDEKLRRFAEHQRALQKYKDEPLSSLSLLPLPPSIPSNSKLRGASPARSVATNNNNNNSNIKNSTKPRSGSAPRPSSFGGSKGSTEMMNGGSDVSGSVSGSVSVRESMEKRPRPMSVGRNQKSSSSPSSSRSINDMPPSNNQTDNSSSSRSQPSKLLQPNFLARRRASPLHKDKDVKDVNQTNGSSSLPSHPPPHAIHPPRSTRPPSDSSHSSHPPRVPLAARLYSNLKPPTPTPPPSSSSSSSSLKTPSPIPVAPTRDDKELASKGIKALPQSRTKPPLQPTPNNTPITTNNNNNHNNNNNKEPPTSRARHPSLATIANKRNSLSFNNNNANHKLTPSGTPVKSSPLFSSSPSFSLGDQAQRERRETEVFEEIEQKIKREESGAIASMDDQDILDSVENELFGNVH